MNSISKVKSSVTVEPSGGRNYKGTLSSMGICHGLSYKCHGSVRTSVQGSLFDMISVQ